MKVALISDAHVNRTVGNTNANESHFPPCVLRTFPASFEIKQCRIRCNVDKERILRRKDKIVDVIQPRGQPPEVTR